MRKNRKEIPSLLLEEKNRPVFSSLFAFTPPGANLALVTLQSYITKRKKPLILMSTFHQNDNLVSNTTTNLSIINDSYNKFKCGVDLVDQVINSSTVQRKTNRWPVNLFYFILNIALTNSYTLCKKLGIINASTLKRDFMEMLAMELCISFVVNRDYSRLDLLHRNDAKLFVDKYNSLFSTSIELNFNKSVLNDSTNVTKGYCSKCLEIGLKKNKLSKTESKCVKCNNIICKRHSSEICNDCK